MSYAQKLLEKISEGSNVVVVLDKTPSADNDVYKVLEIARSVDPKAATSAAGKGTIIVSRESAEKVVAALGKEGHKASIKYN